MREEDTNMMNTLMLGAWHMVTRAVKNNKARKGRQESAGGGKKCQVKCGEVRTFEQTWKSGAGGTPSKCKGPGVRAARRSVELEEMQGPLGRN